MTAFLLRRTLQVVPTLLGVILLTFVLFYVGAGPEQMARRNLQSRSPTREQISAWLHSHGYDRPLPEQFAGHCTELLSFRLGRSDATGESIAEMIRSRLTPSLLLGGMVFAATLVCSVCGALFMASLRGTAADAAGTLYLVLMMSVGYLVYLIGGQFLLARVLKYFPLAGYQEGLDVFKFLAMPGLIGVISGLGPTVRLYRTFVLDELNQDYVRTARASGLSEGVILFGHVLKNASIPILTTVVMSIPGLFLGSLLLESFFAIPGIGGMTIEAIQQQDFAVVRVMVFLGALLTVFCTLLADVVYALVDPRVRPGR